MKKLERIDQKALARNPRANFAAWMRYENIVLTAYKMHPAPHIFVPSLNPNTVVSRIRDAIRGAIAFGFCSSIPIESLKKWYSEIIVRRDGPFGDHVYIGPVETPPPSPLEITTNTDDFVFDYLSFEEVSAFALLISRGRITESVTIKNPPDITMLPDLPNLTKIQKGGALILL